MAPRRARARAGASGPVAALAAVALLLPMEAWGAGGPAFADGPVASPHARPGTEGPLVAAVEVRGLDLLDPPVRLPRHLPLRPGVPWSAEREDATRDLIVERFAERGRPYARVEIREGEASAEEGVHVVVEVTDAGPEVRFGRVEVEAIPPLSEAVVRERIAFREGDLFRPSLLQETQDRLLREAVVARAVVLPVGLIAGQTRATVVVSAAPVERPRGPELHGVLSSARCLEVAGYWRDRYLLGAPRVLSLGAGVSNLFAEQLGNRFPCSEAGEGEEAELNYSFHAELRAPWPGDPQTVVGARGFLRRDSAPPAYVLRGFGVEVGIQRFVRSGVTASLTYTLERSEARAAGAFFCVSFGFCSQEEVAALSRPRRWAPVEAGLSWVPPRTRQALGPFPGRGPRPIPGENGGMVGGSVDAGGLADEGPLVPVWRPWGRVAVAAAGTPTGSRDAYGRLQAEGALARTVGRRGEVAGRLRLGALAGGDDLTLPPVHFFSGGVNRVRGVRQNLLGPRVLVTDPDGAEAMGCQLRLRGCPAGTRSDPDVVVERARGGTLLAEANVEARVRVMDRLQLAGFLDYGILSGPAAEPGAETAGADGSRRGGRTSEAALTPGLGLRADTPLGLLRVDVGYDPRGTRRLPLVADRGVGEDLLFLGEVVHDRFTYDAPGGAREFFRRLHLTVSVGQPF